jgi:Cu+-exporting ATPase
MATEATEDLEIEGMSCAACVRHVEKALTGVDGVLQAEVNLVTNRARVRFDPARVTRDVLVAAVVDAGYEVPAPTPGEPPAPGASEENASFVAPVASEDAEYRHLVRDLQVTAVFALPLMVLAMSHGAIPGAEGVAGRWLQFGLATPVLLGPGRRFFVRAFRGLLRGTADMNTLVALGTGVAWLSSTTALLAPGLFPHGEHGHPPHLYFEASVAILGFVQLGKVLEASDVYKRQALRWLIASTAMASETCRPPASARGIASLFARGSVSRWMASSSKGRPPSTSRSSPARASPWIARRATLSPAAPSTRPEP